MKTNIPPALITFAVVCLALVQNTEAVNPPPDGGYPGGNTAEGQDALLNLATGTYNTAVGLFSLESNLTGNFNTAIGAGTLLTNTADQNTATGAGALLSNTTGENNTASGVFALFDNTTGGSNTSTGFAALGNNTTGNDNTANGANTLLNNTTGNANTAMGNDALTNNTTASGNTAIGSNALLNNTTGGTIGHPMLLLVGPNVAVGASALASNTIASANTAVGYQALGSNTTGADDTALGASTAVGFQALANATGPGSFSNDAFGYQALFTLTGGHDNVSIGSQTLFETTTGSGNVALGSSAGANVTTGSFNICIGSGEGTAGGGITTASNVIAINAFGENVNNSCYIGNIFGATSPAGVGVLVNSDGRLGTSTSSRRFKEEIRPMEQASESLFALKPVTFRYKEEIDPQHISQFGLVAEDVEKIDPDLVVRDKEGKPYSVRYDQVNAMLLNEFLKEHRKNEEQETTIVQLKRELQATAAHQQKQIEALTTGLRKVNTRLEMSRPAPQVAESNY